MCARHASSVVMLGFCVLFACFLLLLLKLEWNPTIMRAHWRGTTADNKAPDIIIIIRMRKQCSNSNSTNITTKFSILINFKWARVTSASSDRDRQTQRPMPTFRIMWCHHHIWCTIMHLAHLNIIMMDAADNARIAAMMTLSISCPLLYICVSSVSSFSNFLSDFLLYRSRISADRPTLFSHLPLTYFICINHSVVCLFVYWSTA